MRASNKLVTIEDVRNICEVSGVAFETSAEISIGSSSDHYTLIYTGNKPFILYERKVSYDGEGFNAFIYRDPIIANITGGTLLEGSSFQNSNDFIDEESGITITVDVTVPDGSEGELTRRPEYVFGNTSNQSQGDALQLIGTPQMVPADKYLLLRLQNRDNSSQSLASHLRWLEPSNIPGIELVNGEWTYRGVAL